MKAIPSMSIAASLDEIFGDNGFYFGYGGEIIKSSIEVLYPDGSSEQIYAGVTGHSNDYLKRSLRLKFCRDYGANKWKMNLLQPGLSTGKQRTHTASSSCGPATSGHGHGDPIQMPRCTPLTSSIATHR